MLYIKEGTFEVAADTKVLKAGDYSAKLTGEEIIKKAEEKAAEIVEEAQKVYESEKVRGYDEGMAEGNEKISELMIDSVARSVQNFEEFENDIVSIVVQALRKVIGEMDKHELISKVVKNAMEQVRNQKKVTIIVNPSEGDLVNKQVDGLLKEFPLVSFIHVESDARIEVGGCKLETDMGVVDASLATQLESIRRSLEKSIK